MSTGSERVQAAQAPAEGLAAAARHPHRFEMPTLGAGPRLAAKQQSNAGATSFKSAHFSDLLHQQTAIAHGSHKLMEQQQWGGQTAKCACS